MASVTTHNDNVSVTVYLSTLATPSASFSIPMLIVEETTNSLNGSRTATYSSLSEATAANTAGYISADTLAIITRMFAQSPSPAKVKVGYIDDGASPAETYAQALTAIIADDSDFYLVLCASRTDADTIALATAIESSDKKMLGVFQTSTSDWKTSGAPAAFSSVSSNERAAWLYHDTDGDWNAEGWATGRAAFDADERSVPWFGRCKGGDALATNPTATERDYVISNGANIGLPQGTETFFVQSGQNISGRQIYEIVSTDWFSTRLQEQINDAVVAASNRGEKITIDGAGQAVVLGIINKLLAQGQQAGHFDPSDDEVSVVAETITSSDLSSNKMRFTVRVKLAGAARLIDIDLYASQTSLAA